MTLKKKRNQYKEEASCDKRTQFYNSFESLIVVIPKTSTEL